MHLLEKIKDYRIKKKTPFLIINKDRIKEKYHLFANILEEAEIYFSVKANSNSQVIKTLMDLGSGFDVASVGELNIVLRQGGDPSKVSFSAPTKIPWHITEAYKKGVRFFAFDSKAELEKIARLAPQSSVFCRVAVPNKGSEWPLLGKFGVEPKGVVPLLKYAQTLGLKPSGTAFHVGSQCLRPQTWVEALKIMDRIWREAKENSLDLELLNLGGGFPVRYQKDIPYIPFILRLIKKTIKNLFPKGIRLILEPGRAIIGDAGILVASVINYAHRGSGLWVYLDTGVYNGLLEILEGFSYEIVTEKDSLSERVEATLAGPTCDSTDIIARNISLPPLEIGDKVFFLNAGAYTISYENYNGIPFPEVVFSESTEK